MVKKDRYMMLQLNPQIPLSTPKGDGFAIMVVDYSQEHDFLWTVALNETGEIWAFPNSQVRAITNFSMGRPHPTVLTKKEESGKISDK